MEKDAFEAVVLYAAISQRYGSVLLETSYYDLMDTETRFSVHHGEADEIISVEWSRKLCEQLGQLDKESECFFYEGQPHTFYPRQEAAPLFIDRTIKFFDRYVRNSLVRNSLDGRWGFLIPVDPCINLLQKVYN